MSAGLEWTGRLASWWRNLIWHRRSPPSSAVRRLLALARAIDTALRSFDADLIAVRAHALTYRTLLSLVPLLAVGFSLFEAFGGLEAGEHALEQRILQDLAPGVATEVVGYIQGFVARFSTGALGGLGAVVLVLTVISVLTYVEEFFNALWNVDRVRPFLDRFVTYWAMITVGPLLFALSLSMTSAIQSDALLARLDLWMPGQRWVLELPFRFLPWLFTWTGMTALYLIVPNTPVRWHAAVQGGVLAGSLWELGKVAFAWASGHIFSYDAVYGAFAAFLVLLLWLQVGWTVVLFGCKVTYALQHERALVEEHCARPVGPAGREFLALRCMIEVARAFMRGMGRPTAEQLAAAAGVLEIEKEVLNRLIHAGLLVAVSQQQDSQQPPREREDESDERYLPSRDPSTITVRQVLNAFRYVDAGPAELGSDDPTSRSVRQLLGRCEDAEASATADLDLAQLVQQIDGEDVHGSGSRESRARIPAAASR